jgi:(p)ppGpp synthase/HD superfamily hydrolase
MPYFETYAEVEVEVDEFLSSCGSKEIKQVIKWLNEEGHLTNVTTPIPENEQLISDKNWNQNCQKLSEIRLQMSMKDIEVIENILKKY